MSDYFCLILLSLFAESEKEVMDEIKKDNKKEKKEDSFHDDKPRKSALKQRKLMDDLKSSASNKVCAFFLSTIKFIRSP